MTPAEQPVVIHSPGGHMLGIISSPAAHTAAPSIGVLLVLGGAQSRAGSHRQCVTLARRLAAAGVACLRFDLPGLGDSPGLPAAFDETAPQLGCAIDTLFQRQPGMQRIVLWGLCDGASACLLYVQQVQDTRVAGLALLNPWLHEEGSLARTQVKHYYRQRVASMDFWRKLLRGGVGWQALKDLAFTLVQTRKRAPEGTQMSFQYRMAQAWHAFPGEILLLLSERDITAQAFVEHASSSAVWRGWERHPGLKRENLPGADHTCSSSAATDQAEGAVVAWAVALRASKP